MHLWAGVPSYSIQPNRTNPASADGKASPSIFALPRPDIRWHVQDASLDISLLFVSRVTATCVASLDFTAKRRTRGGQQGFSAEGITIEEGELVTIIRFRILQHRAMWQG